MSLCVVWSKRLPKRTSCENQYKFRCLPISTYRSSLAFQRFFSLPFDAKKSLVKLEKTSITGLNSTWIPTAGGMPTWNIHFRSSAGQPPGLRCFFAAVCVTFWCVKMWRTRKNHYIAYSFKKKELLKDYTINVQKLPIPNWKLQLRDQILMTITRSYAFDITFHLTRLAKEMRGLR